jgi:hypothetical protein
MVQSTLLNNKPKVELHMRNVSHFWGAWATSLPQRQSSVVIDSTYGTTNTTIRCVNWTVNMHSCNIHFLHLLSRQYTWQQSIKICGRDYYVSKVMVTYCVIHKSSVCLGFVAHHMWKPSWHVGYEIVKDIELSLPHTQPNKP